MLIGVRVVDVEKNNGQVCPQKNQGNFVKLQDLSFSSQKNKNPDKRDNKQ